MPGGSRRPLEDRFWPKVRESTSGCWVWTAGVSPQGYGQIKSGGKHGEGLLAHRVAYELVVGVIPAGYVIDHLCRNKRCVNPAHLEPVRQRENVLRGAGIYVEAYHAGTCLRGHPRTATNTYRHPRGMRICRICKRAAERARSQRMREGDRA